MPPHKAKTHTALKAQKERSVILSFQQYGSALNIKLSHPHRDATMCVCPKHGVITRTVHFFSIQQSADFHRKKNGQSNHTGLCEGCATLGHILKRNRETRTEIRVSVPQRIPARTLCLIFDFVPKLCQTSDGVGGNKRLLCHTVGKNLRVWNYSAQLGSLK